MTDLCYPAMGKAFAQSLSRPGGDQVTPDNLDPSPPNERAVPPSPEDAELYRRETNKAINSRYFRAPMTEREMQEADRLKKHPVDAPRVGRSLNEAEAIEEIWMRRTPRDLDGRDYDTHPEAPWRR
jgi:hypothetical protein